MGLVESILLAGGGGSGGAFHYLWDSRVIFPRTRATDRGSYTRAVLKSWKRLDSAANEKEIWLRK